MRGTIEGKVRLGFEPLGDEYIRGHTTCQSCKNAFEKWFMVRIGCLPCCGYCFMKEFNKDEEQ